MFLTNSLLIETKIKLKVVEIEFANYTCHSLIWFSFSSKTNSFG